MSLALAIQLVVLVVVADVLVAWVQPDAGRWPRRLLHLLTEPLLVPIRWVLNRLPLGGWDLSPVVLVVLLGAARVAVLQH